jgi:hypothetical protein
MTSDEIIEEFVKENLTFHFGLWTAYKRDYFRQAVDAHFFGVSVPQRQA